MTYPLTQTQLGIYATCMNSQEEGNYNIDMLYKLDNDVDIDRLANALECVVEAHPYIKSRLAYDDNGEVVLEDHSADLFHTPVFETDDIEDVRSHLGEDYDLMNDQLFRLEIYKTKNGNYLYADFHHILFDGMSFAIFRSDLAKAYDGQKLNPEPKNGFQIAEEECEKRKSEAFEEAKQWYLQEFAEAEDVNSMPIPDVQKPTADGPKFTVVWKEIEFDRAKLDALCKKAGVKESMVFTSAFGYTLSKYTNDEKVQYTTVFHGRNDKLTRQSLCMMVQTLPVFHNFKPSQSVAEALQHTSAQMAGTRKNTCFSFGELHEALGITSEILFVYQGTLGSYSIFLNDKEQEFEDLRVHRIGINLNIQIIIENGKYFAKTEYPTNKFTPEFIDGLLQSYNNIFCEMLVKEDLKDIETCNEAQLQVLDSFNQQEPICTINPEKTILDYFREHVEATPDREYLVCGDVRLSFREVDEISDALAVEILQRLSQKPKAKDQQPVVAIILNRNEYMAIAPLAAMKAGCAYQPLDPSYPQERLNFMVKDADAQVLIAEDGLEQLVNEYEGEVIKVESGKNKVESGKLKDKQPLPGVKPEDLLILLYTSGTTGVPKGVRLLHSNITTYAQFSTVYLGITTESKITAYASFGFDAYMSDMAMSFVAGSSLFIIPEEIRLDLIQLKEYYDEQGITHSFMTTQVACQFAQTFPEMKTLQVLFMGGEKMASIPVPNYNTVNIYGPTETTVYVTHFLYKEYESNIPIGKPNQGVNAYIVDQFNKRLPVGAAGELLVSGAQVGAGYLNRPDKTADVFIEYNGESTYRTGDVVRYREDGNIEFVGRKDGMVKIRGFRIELKEVESVIRDFPGIKDCTVQAFDLDAGGKALAAYVVSDESIDIEKLNDFILEQKPPYMVPAVTMQIDAIPLNVNQKVDKKKLPKPEVSQHSSADSQQQAANLPLNSLEQEIHDIIAPIINTEEFSIVEPLGYLGLSSITSIKLAVQIFKQFGVQLDSKSLAKTGTLQSIENEILNAWREKIQNPTEVLPKKEDLGGSPVKGDSEGSSFPLTYPQLGVYFDCMKNPGTTLYNVPCMLTLPEGTDEQKVIDAVKATINNHQSMKFVFRTEDGETVQLVDESIPVEVAVKEMTVDEMNLYKDNFMMPFNISKGPLFRFEVVKTPNPSQPNSTIINLFIDMHHLITDGGSLDIVIKEITSRLNGADVEKEDYTYSRFALEQKAAENGEEYKAAKEFFHNRLSTCEGASEIANDLPKKDDAVHTLGVVRFPVDFDTVQATAKSLGVTPMSIFLAATYYTISRYVNNKQIYLGTISNGRSNLHTYNTTGMFVNTLALSSEIKEQSVREYIAECAQNFNETMLHEQYPFAQISADYGFKPEIIFEYQVGVVSNYEVDGKPAIMQVLSLDLAKFKMKVAVYDSLNGGQDIVIGYDEALYSPQLAAGLAESVAAVSLAFAKNLDTKVKNTSIMSDNQLKEVEKLRTVATAPIENRLFFEPLQHYAETQPDSIALIACDRTLTYKELNSDANRIAHALMKRGVKRGDRVVLLLPRDSRIMLSIYGVSKTGAAYIPCDPSYPSERIKLITEDSEAAYVITTAEHMAEHGSKAILVDELLSSSETNTENPNVEISPDDLVYLIYTSGSTGRPKGVMLRHEGICNYLQNHPCNRHIHAFSTLGHIYLCVTTLSFDMSLKEYGGAFFNGLTAVLANEDQCNNPVELARLFKETGADIMNATPSRLLNYMELPDFCDALGQCKVILSGGEPYSDKLLARLHSITKARIFNTYGPTEITVSSNCKELTHTNAISIGQPLLNYTEFVVDIDGNELPVGVVGELYIGGVGVAKGYNNLEKQTQERFVDYKGVRCYRSGDYARWTPEGDIVTLGRMDNQIKLRGLRIELGEVESAICKVEGIKQTFVMVKKINDKEHLAAYFTADRPIVIEDLKAQIGTMLTHYMVPTAYLQMDKFPLTPNGKTDVKHLPDPLLAQVGGEYVAPKNKLEQDFCDIFQRILDLEKVSAVDSFFDLGGTSLTVTRVIIEAKNLGYDVAYADVFKQSSPRQLAALVDDSNTDGASNIDHELEDYDYTKINQLLAANTLDSFKQGERLELNDVILTGANGYLGIHILHELLENHIVSHPDATIYCLVRHGRNGMSSESRLKNLLYYYFEKNYRPLFGTRLIIIDGDVTNASAFDAIIQNPESRNQRSLQSATLINCAAIVKHFSDGTEIEDINIGGLQNCVNFCLKTGARLIQTSTNSTGGQSINGYPDPNLHYSEQVHYFGQSLTSKYTHSKFIAERIVLEAVAEKGLIAKVVRLGNLAPRATDGEFQINFRSNSAMGRLHIYQMLGCRSYAQSVSTMEFSPIDEVARAILLLATAPKECVVFHPFNNHTQLLGDVIDEMARTLDTTIIEVEDEVFEDKLQQAGQDPEKAKILQSMLAYKASSKDKVTGYPKYNPYTIQVLSRLGFHWNVTSWDYVSRFIKAIASLDFFRNKR